MVNVQYAFIKKPGGYSIELAQQYLKKYENKSSNQTEDSVKHIKSHTFIYLVSVPVCSCTWMYCNTCISKRFQITYQTKCGILRKLYTTNYKWENVISVEEESFPQTEEYLSSTYVSDKAFEYLIDYFEKEEEPVLIFMFGDHQPSIENEFFELLLGKSLTELTTNYKVYPL